MASNKKVTERFNRSLNEQIKEVELDTIIDFDKTFKSIKKDLDKFYKTLGFNPEDISNLGIIEIQKILALNNVASDKIDKLIDKFLKDTDNNLISFFDSSNLFEYFKAENLSKVLDTYKQLPLANVRNLLLDSKINGFTIGERIVSIGLETKRRVTDFITSRLLSGGASASRINLTKAIRDIIGAVDGKGATRGALAKANRIVRTEMARAVNKGNQVALEQIESEGLIRPKEIWRATLDDRTRLEHLDADGQEKENGFFSVGGELLEAPTLGSIPENNINCRCYVETAYAPTDKGRFLREQQKQSGKIAPPKEWKKWKEQQIDKLIVQERKRLRKTLEPKNIIF